MNEKLKYKPQKDYAIKQKSIFYREETRTRWQDAVNRASYELVKNDPCLADDRNNLLIKVSFLIKAVVRGCLGSFKVGRGVQGHLLSLLDVAIFCDTGIRVS